MFGSSPFPHQGRRNCFEAMQYCGPCGTIAPSGPQVKLKCLLWLPHVGNARRLEDIHPKISKLEEGCKTTLSLGSKMPLVSLDEPLHKYRYDKYYDVIIDGSEQINKTKDSNSR